MARTHAWGGARTLFTSRRGCHTRPGVGSTAREEVIARVRCRAYTGRNLRPAVSTYTLLRKVDLLRARARGAVPITRTRDRTASADLDFAAESNGLSS